MAEEKSVQRWTAKRRAALALSIMRGETSVQKAARVYRAALPRDCPLWVIQEPEC